MYIKEVIKADLNICDTADSFLQSAMWGEFKSRFDWTAVAFEINWEKDAQKTPLLVLSRRLAPGFSFAYVPWGPELPDGFQNDLRPKALGELALKLKPLLSNNAFFIRFEPPWYDEDGAAPSKDEDASFFSRGFLRAAATVQPPDTVIINLKVPCDEILAAMKPKWRYNISLAEKKGVLVNHADGVHLDSTQELETFYSLLKETAERDGIAIHSFNYYKTLFEVCAGRSKNGENLTLRLYTAVHEGDTLAAIVVLFRGKYATYLYGASSNIKRNLMAPYALQWKAMQDAKEAGCQYYDLFGIPPDDDPNHPMAGLYRFKTGFGGQIVHRPGSWDYPYKKAVYSLFNVAEAFRKKLRDRKKKHKEHRASRSI